MGLVKDGNRFAVLTDILGDEDYLGDMDFKVAGTAQGVTALQMDIKIDRVLPKKSWVRRWNKQMQGACTFWTLMNSTLQQARTEMSAYAPRILNISIPTDKIRDVIGKGGATIRC